ncbi:MAG: dTMP kinase [Firmicutes bacterium]|nr:dTMP kinase [Bacillota bacterium]
MSGLLITLEGTDGAGKTTQIKLLEKYLKNKGYEVLCTREPGGTDISEKIRKLIIDPENTEMSPLTEALLYSAARAQLVKQVIIPALKGGSIVICDRFVDSSIVYQGIARGLGAEMIAELNKYATGGLIPDITFFLRLESGVGINRKKKQDKLDRIELEKESFHKRVLAGYIELCKKNPERIKTIDASKSIDDIHGIIVSHTEETIKKLSL